MAGWAGSTRSARLPKNWSKLREAAFRRDGYQCTARSPQTGKRCDGPAEECDHMRPGDDHSMSNLTSLCKWHHARKSAREGAVASASSKKKRRKKYQRVERHPGRLD